MNEIWFSILQIILGFILGLATVLVVIYIKNKKDERVADNIINTAKKDAEKIKRDSLFETKEEIHKIKLEADKEIKDKKNEVKEAEDRLLQRENNIDRRDLAIQKKRTKLRR